MAKKDEEQTKEDTGRWAVYAECRKDAYVNCAFAEEGSCLNPKHKDGGK